MEEDNLPRALISLVIATRNRVACAISAIHSILEINDSRLELVVQDNSDSRELESYVDANICDSRFRYRYTPPPFSSIDNFNAALQLATGDYICLIGDDDGVNPEIMEAASWAKRERLDALAWKQKAGYLWSAEGALPRGVKNASRKMTGGDLAVYGFTEWIAEADLEEEMKKLVRNGGLYYPNFRLPKLYHGMVHRRCLKAVYERTGTFLGGLSPDIYALLSIACIAKRVMVTEYPLTIWGACEVSSMVIEGAPRALRRHSTRLEDAPHLRDRGEYSWCKLVPRFYSAETIWVDSGVAALRAMGRDDLVQQLNLPRLAAYCVLANRGVTQIVLRDLFGGLRIMGKSPAIGTIQFAWSLLMIYGVKFVQRAWYRSRMIVGIRSVHTISGLQNMVEVSRALTCYLKENGRSFSNCVRHNAYPL